MKLQETVTIYCGGPGSGRHPGPNPGVRWNWKKYSHLVKEGEILDH